MKRKQIFGYRFLTTAVITAIIILVREAPLSVLLPAAGSVAIVTEYRFRLALKLVLPSHSVSSAIPIPQSALFPFCACSLALTPPAVTGSAEATQSLEASFGTRSTTEAPQQNRHCPLRGF